MSDPVQTPVQPPAAGDTFIWGTGAAVTATVLMMLTVLGVILFQGLGTFWAGSLVETNLADGQKLLGEVTAHHVRKDGTNRIAQTQFNVRNRDLYGLDFRWVNDADLGPFRQPADALVLERLEYGAFSGFLREVKPGEFTLTAAEGLPRLREAMAVAQRELDALDPWVAKRDAANRELEKIRLRRLKLVYRGAEANAAAIAALDARKAELDTAFAAAQEEYVKGVRRIATLSAVFADVNGRTKEMEVRNLVRVYAPNAMGLGSKLALYGARVWELLAHEPRESNTEGGIFPAIFGTVMMVILMSLFCMPFGVVAAIYLREYAKEGPLVRTVRIAVNNLAGVPSIVYGIFGLGFFVYGVGGTLDDWFFPERLPTPTFGTGGILWASLTLALLTVPVVIVATEEALSSIPRGMREGSFALGATKWQTVRSVLLPMASPGIMTGFILSMSRAAGEVAPLMITGVVKLAPSLPLDGTPPFAHLERKFMHLGFHIYDVGFQSPNVEAARPMVFVTTLVLLVIVILLNITAILTRNRMRRRYTMGAF
jgi:phosphate transport system permease protein